jgi:hypothetical protein
MTSVSAWKKKLSRFLTDDPCPDPAVLEGCRRSSQAFQAAVIARDKAYGRLLLPHATMDAEPLRLEVMRLRTRDLHDILIGTRSRCTPPEGPR